MLFLTFRWLSICLWRVFMSCRQAIFCPTIFAPSVRCVPGHKLIYWKDIIYGSATPRKAKKLIHACQQQQLCASRDDVSNSFHVANILSLKVFLTIFGKPCLPHSREPLGASNLLTTSKVLMVRKITIPAGEKNKTNVWASLKCNPIWKTQETLLCF